MIVVFSFGNLSAQAQWTGISVDIGESSSDLQFETGQRTMSMDSLSLQIEEKAATDLRVGFSVGLNNFRNFNILPPENAQKFEGSQLGFYLRLPMQLGEYFSLEGLYSFRYNTATESNVSSPSEVEWHENRLKISIGTVLKTMGFNAFIAYHDMSGDISTGTSVERFESIDNISRGISLDFFVEPTAFIRLQLSRGAEDSGYLSFVRVY